MPGKAVVQYPAALDTMYLTTQRLGLSEVLVS